MTAVAVPPPVQDAAPGRTLRRAARTYSFGFAALLTVALLITNIATQHGGFGWSNQLANVAPMAIAALASAPSIIGGGFDLSISPLITLTNCVFVVYLLPHGLGGAIAVPIMLGTGLAVGALNGILIVLLRVQPIVVTLAMFFSLQGIDLIIAPNPASVPGTGWVRHLATTVGAVPGAIFTIGIPSQVNMVFEAAVVIIVCLIQSPDFRRRITGLRRGAPPPAPVAPAPLETPVEVAP